MADELNVDVIKMPDGTVLRRSSIVEQSINFYKEAYGEELTDVTDFSVGSEIRTLHESWAVDLFNLYLFDEKNAKQKFVRYATGTYLDELGCEYHLSRKKAEVATGTVTFVTSATINGSMNVPKGTVILDYKTGYEYILQDDVILTETDKPVNGQVYSKLTGAKYNAPRNRLRTFRDIGTIRSEIKVTNNTEITDGLDEESDEEFRERILDAKKTSAYGTATAYSTLIVDEIPDVHDVQFVDPAILITDESYPKHFKQGTQLKNVCKLDSKKNVLYNRDGTPVYLSLADLKKKNVLCTACVAVLYVNCWGKPTPDHVIEDVEFLMTQQNNLVVGQKFHIEKAQSTYVYLDIELFVVATIDDDILFDHIMAFFDGGTVSAKTGNLSYHGLNIGEPLYKARIIDVIENIPGVYQVGSLKQTKYNPDIPTNITQWNNNGGAGFSYEDDDGYVYHRTNSEDSSIDYWGVQNFLKLETKEGCVFQLGQKKDIDESSEDVIGIKQYLVDSNGTVLTTESDEDEDETEEGV